MIGIPWSVYTIWSVYTSVWIVLTSSSLWIYWVYGSYGAAVPSDLNLILHFLEGIKNGSVLPASSKFLPQNTVVVVNGTIQLLCSNREPVIWNILYANGTEATIFTGYVIKSQFENDFSVDTSHKGAYPLMINRTKLEHAGTYKCQKTHLKAYRAYLIVLGEYWVDTGRLQRGIHSK